MTCTSNTSRMYSSRVFSCCVLLLLLSLGTLEVAAQHRAPEPARRGFWLEAGAGTGGVWVGCAGCEAPAAAFGESTYLRAGGTFSERVAWGVEAFTLLNETIDAARSDSTLRVENISLGPVVLWYPWRNDVFIKGGIGMAVQNVGLRDADAPNSLAKGVGSAMSVGVGLDVPVASWLSLTINLGAYFSAVGDITVGETFFDDMLTTMYNANVAVTLR